MDEHLIEVTIGSDSADKYASEWRRLFAEELGDGGLDELDRLTERYTVERRKLPDSSRAYDSPVFKRLMFMHVDVAQFERIAQGARERQLRYKTPTVVDSTHAGREGPWLRSKLLVDARHGRAFAGTCYWDEPG